MSVFRNYNSKQAGGVNANAFPRVHPIPWIPNQRNVRANPNIPSQPQRIQPNERGAWFPGSSNGGGTLAPEMSSGCGGCGGRCGNGSQHSGDGGPTPSDLSTTHSFPGDGGSQVIAPRPSLPRVVGAVRSRAPSPARIKARPFSAGGLR